jgi:glycosyltransferase involved in cell wall biosynthesis/2-polyprenyl-3-methyl-5-hydroxy-6-metoxy-1,4-benzoquinol methylase
MNEFVSCIMPTANRRRFVPRAIRCFLAQDYPNKELVILDDGAESVADLIPDDPQIRYTRLTGTRTLGRKRNECVEASRSDLIMHWDDDDWHAPHRIRVQVEALLAANAEVCSVTQMLYCDLETGEPWLYHYRGKRSWLAGGTLLYTRDFWRRGPFPDIQVASDTRFIFDHSLERATIMSDYQFYVAMIHPTNTSRKATRGTYWSRWPGDLRAIMGSDLDAYLLPAAAPEKKPVYVSQMAAPRPAARSLTPLPTVPVQEVRPMRIGYVLWNFPPLTETFIRREVLALCDDGHRVTVYAHHLYDTGDTPAVTHPNLTVRRVSLTTRAELAKAVREDGIEHLRSSLMAVAHRACYETARALQIPFTITAYSGHDIFSGVDSRLYAAAAADPLCEAIIVEDPFMREWISTRYGVPEDRMALVANSFDLEQYRLSTPRPVRNRVVILAIARFIEKKGLIYLVRAFNQVSARNPDVELWLVGGGVEETALRQAANARVKFLGQVSEARTRALYAEADIFCLPCVQTARGDADGIPTTVLEAMAFELPVITSNLLSAPYYVRDRQEGILTPPCDVAAIAEALAELCANPELRRALGRAGRARVEALCDVRQNARVLETIITDGRWRRWQQKLDDLMHFRSATTPERQAYYTSLRQTSMAFLQPRGLFLDIGCGAGKMREHVPAGVIYVGIDPMLTEPPQSGFRFGRARGEALPFANDVFDSALIYTVLINVFSVDAVLDEAARVLKPGGLLLLRVCVNDPNPLHLNHLSEGDLLRRLSHYGTVLATQYDRGQLLVRAQIGTSAPPEHAPVIQVASNPLVSIAITTYNRAQFLRRCIDSVLNQTYQPVDIVVVDDGSSDETHSILTAYGKHIRAFSNEKNCGIPYTKNRALLETPEEAQFIGILDSDDYQHPRFVERCVAFLQAHPQHGLVYTDDILVNERGHEIQRQPAVHPWDVDTWLSTCNLRGDTWLARRDLVMQTSLHDERLSHDVDYDLFYQLLEITSFGHLAEFLIYVRQHAGRTTTQQQLELAKCHAANLVKFGYSAEYAFKRARRHPEWIPAIEAGITLGKQLRAQRQPTQNA